MLFNDEYMLFIVYLSPPSEYFRSGDLKHSQRLHFSLFRIGFPPPKLRDQVSHPCEQTGEFVLYNLFLHGLKRWISFMCGND